MQNPTYSVKLNNEAPELKEKILDLLLLAKRLHKETDVLSERVAAAANRRNIDFNSFTSAILRSLADIKESNIADLVPSADTLAKFTCDIIEMLSSSTLNKITDIYVKAVHISCFAYELKKELNDGSAAAAKATAVKLNNEAKEFVLNIENFSICAIFGSGVYTH